MAEIENWNTIKNIFTLGESNETPPETTDNWERIKEIFLLTASSEETLDQSDASSTGNTGQSADTLTSGNT